METLYIVMQNWFGEQISKVDDLICFHSIPYKHQLKQNLHISTKELYSKPLLPEHSFKEMMINKLSAVWQMDDREGLSWG